MGHEGHCLCGQVVIKVNSDTTGQIACHCEDCQHVTGSAHSCEVLVEEHDVELQGPLQKYIYPSASGNTVTRTFCENCGSPLTFQSTAFEGMMAVHTGNLPDLAKLPFSMEVFTAQRWMIPVLDGATQFVGPPAM